jgi:hypothetical protein
MKIVPVAGIGREETHNGVAGNPRAVPEGPKAGAWFGGGVVVSLATPIGVARISVTAVTGHVLFSERPMPDDRSEGGARGNHGGPQELESFAQRTFAAAVPQLGERMSRLAKVRRFKAAALVVSAMLVLAASSAMGQSACRAADQRSADLIEQLTA